MNSSIPDILPTLQAVIFITTFVGIAFSIAIVLLVLSQLSHDSKSITFLAVAVAVAVVTLMSCLLQLSNHAPQLGLEPQSLLEVMCVPVFGLPLFLLLFTIEYLSKWTRQHRVLVIIFSVQFLTSSAVALDHLWLFDVRFQPDGALVFTPYITLISAIMNVWLTWNTWFGFVFFLNKARKALSVLPVRIRSLLAGLLMINLGMLLNSSRFVTQYSIGTDLMVCGVVFLTPAVLKQRLFDPISQLNHRLKSRADQLALLARVGQRASSVLNLHDLLDRVTKDTENAFGYHKVSIHLVGTNAACDSQKPDASNAPGRRFDAFPESLVYIPNVKKGDSNSYRAISAQTRSMVIMPLCIGTTPEQLFIGTLQIEDVQPHAFSKEDLDILQILAQQLVVAIRNAELFEAAQRANEAKNWFIGYISHEVRNPLHNIRTSVQGVLDSYYVFSEPLPESYRQEFKDIHEQALHLGNLVDDLLDLSKIEAGKLEIAQHAVDPLSVLEDVAQAIKPHLKADVTIRVEYDTPLPCVWADERRLRQVLLNLLNNAAKFTSDGSIKINAQVEDRVLRFSIIDTGIGIAQDKLDKLFNPYTQASAAIGREYGGTGLGLNISRRFVELHGGQIKASSQIGKGTTFNFTIPLAEIVTCHNV